MYIWPLKRDDLLSGVKIHSFMLSFTFPIVLSREFVPS